MGAPDPENSLFLGLSVLRGGFRPWSWKGPDHGVGVDPQGVSEYGWKSDWENRWGPSLDLSRNQSGEPTVLGETALDPETVMNRRCSEMSNRSGKFGCHGKALVKHCQAKGSSNESYESKRGCNYVPCNLAFGDSKITSTSTERQRRSQNLAPVLVILSGNSLVFSRNIISSARFYRCSAPSASAPVVVKNQSPSNLTFWERILACRWKGVRKKKQGPWGW